MGNCIFGGGARGSVCGRRPVCSSIHCWFSTGPPSCCGAAGVAPFATGTGRAAQIGRPVAGKTGTTSSNKDGWFLGFSSGLTTGVWMGRDDAKPVGGLQGGHAPAKAFSDYMRVAVAGRPIEPFDTEVKLPEWQLEDENDAYLGEPGQEGLTDDNGMPIELPYDSRPPQQPDEAQPQPQPQPDNGPVLNQQWIEEQTGRRPAPSDLGGAPKGSPQGKIVTVPAPKAPPTPTQKGQPPRGPNGDGN